MKIKELIAELKKLDGKREVGIVTVEKEGIKIYPHLNHKEENKRANVAWGTCLSLTPKPT